MQLTPLQYTIAIISFIAYLSLTSIMTYRRSYSRWPFLYSLAIFEILSEVILLNLTGHTHYAAYFYTYWASKIIRALLGLGLIFDIIRAIPGIGLAPRHLLIGFTAAAAAMTTGSAWLASSGGPQSFHFTMMALSLDRCIAVTWATFSVSLFCAVGFCGLGWTPTPLRVAATFLVLTLISGANAYAMSAWLSIAYKIDTFFSLCTVGVWITWSAIMHFEKEQETVTQSDRAIAFAKALVLPSNKTAN